MGFCALQLADVTSVLLIRKVTKALSLLAEEEPIKLGEMLLSIQIVDFNGIEWK